MALGLWQHDGRGNLRKKNVHLMAFGKQRVNEKGDGISNIPIEGMPWMIYVSLTRLYLLQVPSLPNNAMGWHPSLHFSIWAFGGVLNSNA
jgi:hypothetical protein